MRCQLDSFLTSEARTLMGRNGEPVRGMRGASEVPRLRRSGRAEWADYRRIVARVTRFDADVIVEISKQQTLMSDYQATATPSPLRGRRTRHRRRRTRRDDPRHLCIHISD